MNKNKSRIRVFQKWGTLRYTLRGSALKKVVGAVFVCLIVAVALLAVEVFKLKRAGDSPKFNTTYQAVLLDDGQVYYGKLSQTGSHYPKMTSVYYVVRTVDPSTKQTKNVLVKRGKEWHAPTETFFNARHIIVIEPVNPNSEVAKLIAQAESQPQQ